MTEKRFIKQIDVEKINTESVLYSARIVFNFKEFELIRKIWGENR